MKSANGRPLADWEKEIVTLAEHANDPRPEWGDAIEGLQIIVKFVFECLLLYIFFHFVIKFW